MVVRCRQGKSMCPQARGERTALQVVANGQPVQGSRSFATPKKGGTRRWTQDPIRVFCNPYTIGLSAIPRLLDESPSLSADDDPSGCYCGMKISR